MLGSGMKHPAVLMLAVTLLSAGITPAAAAIIEVTASGTIENGGDNAGLFGTAGADLKGSVYSLIFNIDTSRGYVVGGVDYIPQHGPTYYSSTFHSKGPVPGVTASFTLGGTTIFIDGSSLGLNGYSVSLHTNQNNLRQFSASADTQLSFNDFYDPIYPASPLSDPSDGVFHDPNLDPISFSIDTRGYQFYVGNFLATRALGTTSLELNSDKMDYTVISAAGGPTSFIPEPSTWALMLGGFGLVGAAVRRKDKRSLSAVAA